MWSRVGTWETVEAPQELAPGEEVILSDPEEIQGYEGTLTVSVYVNRQGQLIRVGFCLCPL